jgi:Tol biopolymer transport system component
MVARGITLMAFAVLMPGGAVAQSVAEVQVAPPSVTIKVGERAALLATAFDRAGNVIPTVTFIWSSNNLAVAKIDNEGTVTGVGGGVALIEARIGARRGQAAVQVIASQPGGPPPVSGAPPAPSQQPGGEPVAPPADGLAGQPQGTGPAAVLRIDPPTVYLLPSENTRVYARPLKEDGSPAAPVSVTWRSLRPDIASVDQNGLVVALAPGQGTVQVTSATGLNATAPLVVQQSDIAIFEATPVALSPGGVDTLHVIVPAQGNRVVSPVAMQWATADPNIARVSLTGVVTAVAPGRTTLLVSGLLQSKVIDVVVHKTVAELRVSPSFKQEVPLPIGGTTTFQVQALAGDQTLVPEAPLRWTVDDPSLAVFDPATGTMSGKRAGRTTLTVRGPGPGLTVTWQIRVLAAGVRLSASRIGLPVNRRYALRASFTDEAGAVLGPATGVTWSSDNPSVAAVGQDGMVTSLDYGHARIVATAPESRRATTEVFVQGEIVVASSRSGRFQLYATERSSVSQLRKIMDDPAAATEAAFSPDGSRIAFVSTRDGQPEIYVMDADGSNATRLTNARAPDADPTFTGDGQSVVFMSKRGAHRQIFVQPITGSDAVPLTQEPTENWQPAVSPDGETIAFVSTREGNQDIWLMSKDGSNQRAFTKTPQVRESCPKFLRDGSLAYLVEHKQGGRTVTEVVKADLATAQVTPLTGSNLLISEFAVSTAGDLLALVVGEKNLPRVVLQLAGAAAGPPMPLAATGSEQMTSPAFMP